METCYELTCFGSFRHYLFNFKESEIDDMLVQYCTLRYKHKPVIDTALCSIERSVSKQLNLSVFMKTLFGGFDLSEKWQGFSSLCAKYSVLAVRLCNMAHLHFRQRNFELNSIIFIGLLSEEMIQRIAKYGLTRPENFSDFSWIF